MSRSTRKARRSAALRRLRARLPKAPASLANSAGILLGRHYHYDLVRPGIALYGGERTEPRATTIRARRCASTRRILQVRDVAAGETVGYGATRTVKRHSRIAILAVGYADGLFRALSPAMTRKGFVVYLGAHPAPILGRVSMDLITVDVTGVPEHFARRGAWVELIGPNVTAQTLAPTPAPSTTRFSPISAPAPCGAISAASVPPHGQGLQSLCLPGLRRGGPALGGPMRVVRRVEQHRRGGRSPVRPRPAHCHQGRQGHGRPLRDPASRHDRRAAPPDRHRRIRPRARAAASCRAPPCLSAAIPASANRRCCSKLRRRSPSPARPSSISPAKRPPPKCACAPSGSG